MRILLFCQALTYGGAQRQLALLAIGLKRRGHDVAVAVFYREGPFAEELTQAGVTVHDLAKRGRWDVFGFLARLRHLVARERPDLIYAFLPMPNILATFVVRLVRPRPRLVFGVRAARMMTATNYDWLSHQQYRIEAFVSGMADLVVVNSHDGLADITARGFRAARAVVVANGIDTALFAPDPAGRKRLRASWGVGEDDILVGHVARFDPMKDHATFFAAAATVVRVEPAWRFVCIGVADGAAERQARRLAAAQGVAERIIFAGAHSDMAACYAALDIACQASRFGEGFPNVVAEAMACGVPCVVTDVGDARAIVGDLGVVVPPGDASALAGGLHDMRQRLGADRMELTTALRRSIVECYGVEACVAATEQALRALLA